MAHPNDALDAMENLPWYSQARPDSDGVLRRIAPAKGKVEHIAYVALKQRWPHSMIEHTEKGPALVNRFGPHEDGAASSFLFDRGGNILLEKQNAAGQFRRLAHSRFLEYDNAERAMARLLKETEPLGVFDHTLPENRPLILFDFAEILKEEMLEGPSNEALAAWVRAREKYLESLDDFLYGPDEMMLVNGYEILIAEEGLGGDGEGQLQAMRDSLIRAFVAMRAKHRELMEIRAELEKALELSFCIMGPLNQAQGNIPLSSALLANALLTGRSITPGQNSAIIFWALLASFVALACIHALRPLTLLVTGLGATLFCGIAFSLSFVLSAYWIDPLVPASACLAGVLALSISRFCISYKRELYFRLAYRPHPSKAMLALLAKAGRPGLPETGKANAAIVAAKKTGLLGLEDSADPSDAAKAASQFRSDFSSAIFKAGAIVLGFEGDIAFACFGSPLELFYNRLAKKAKKDGPAIRAAATVQKLLQNPPDGAKWQFGIESGECAFSWSHESGYIAIGPPVVRARAFAALAKKHQVHAIIGETSAGEIGQKLRKLSMLGSKNFYELPEEGE
jgi:class 3 adenylate cyclase